MSLNQFSKIPINFFLSFPNIPTVQCFQRLNTRWINGQFLKHNVFLKWSSNLKNSKPRFLKTSLLNLTAPQLTKCSQKHQPLFLTQTKEKPGIEIISSTWDLFKGKSRLRRNSNPNLIKLQSQNTNKTTLKALVMDLNLLYQWSETHPLMTHASKRKQKCSYALSKNNLVLSTLSKVIDSHKITWKFNKKERSI